VLVARAEAALLDNDLARARAELAPVRDLVFERGNPWQRGDVAWLLWQAGERDIPTDGLAAPYALLIAGDVAGAGAAWRERGCPYEEALALAASDDPDAVRRGLATFERLGAQPMLGRAFQRLRDLGERDLPVIRRGPIATTRSNPAGLTQREVEVLVLVAEGLRNPEIAERLYLTPKTVSHHLTSVYGKLGVSTRVEAARIATRLGITSET
jgi:DNA-binding CsgD family transcriptional regulator